MSLTRLQEHLLLAWNQVQVLDNGSLARYRDWVRSADSLIHRAGLCQALHQVQQDPVGQKLVEHLEAHLDLDLGGPRPGGLVGHVKSCPGEAYRLAIGLTREALAWQRRILEARFDDLIAQGGQGDAADRSGTTAKGFTCRQELQGVLGCSENPLLALEPLAHSDPNDPTSGKIAKHLDRVIAQEDWGPLFDLHRQQFEMWIKDLAGHRGNVEGGTTRFFEIRIKHHLLSGSGIASINPLGINLDFLSGMPILWGHSLKGFASAEAAAKSEASWQCGSPGQLFADQGADHRKLFGDARAEWDGEGQGLVTFNDAWWVPEPGRKTLPLLGDTLNPHQLSSYMLKGMVYPDDCTDPIPVPFLCVTGAFLLPLSGPEAWVDAAAALLKKGLEERGLGAFSSAGYGRASMDPYIPPVESTNPDVRPHLVPGRAGSQPDTPGGANRLRSGDTEFNLSK